MQSLFTPAEGPFHKGRSAEYPWGSSLTRQIPWLQTQIPAAAALPACCVVTSLAATQLQGGALPWVFLRSPVHLLFFHPVCQLLSLNSIPLRMLLASSYLAFKFQLMDPTSGSLPRISVMHKSPPLLPKLALGASAEPSCMAAGFQLVCLHH